MKDYVCIATWNPIFEMMRYHWVHKSEKDPVQSIRKFKNCIWNIHIEDIKDKKHFHLIPGQGDMDFTKIFKVLREIKYDNFITVELYTYQKQPVSAARKSYDFLNRFI